MDENLTRNLSELLDEVNNKTPSVSEIKEELIDKILEEMKCIPKLNFQKEHRHLAPKLDQCAVNLWNVAVAKKTGGNISPQLNAKIRHTACNLVYLCNSDTQHVAILKKQTMMALKTARAWLDANESTMSDNPLSMAHDCIEKRLQCFLRDKEAGGGDADLERFRNIKQELDKDQFKYLCYKAEGLCSQGNHTDSLQLVNQAKGMVERLPSERAYLALLCYNLGVECFQKSDYDSSVQWLRESFELGKVSGAVGCKNQARTLRLLAHAYLDWDSKVHWQKALNSVGLANAEYPHPAGLYLKIRIHLEGKENDERLKSGVDDVLRHPELTIDLGLNTIKLITQHGRNNIACDGLKQLSQRFENTPHAGQVMIIQLETLIQAKETDSAKTMIESIITGDHTGNHIEENTRKRIHLILWEQAAIAFEQNDYSSALEWYNYSLSLYVNNEIQDSNLAKLHRNRATCYLQLEKIDEAEDAVKKAETSDSESPHTYYLKYKIALLKEQDSIAISSLQNMGNCIKTSNNSSTAMEEDGGVNELNQNYDVIHGLICLAAQLAFDRNNRSVAMEALESIVTHSSDPNQVLTALRCLIRLKLSLQDDVNAGLKKNEMIKIGSYVKTAYEKLVYICGQSSQTPANVPQEASWFMKIAWNMGLKCDHSYVDMQKFFVICNQLQLLCAADSGSLSRSKTCLLMAAAAGLQIAKGSHSEQEKQEALKQTLTYANECKQVLHKIEQTKVTDKDTHNLDNTTPVLLILYEFEAKALLGEKDLEQVLERAMTLPHCEAKVFETIAALAQESSVDNLGLTSRALKLAIKKHLLSDPVNFSACSQCFHSLIGLALQNGLQNNSIHREEAWNYFQDVVDVIENKAKEEYPDTEILWLMTKAWNCGIHLHSASKYDDALQWCELAMKLLNYVGQHQVNYEKQMSSVYSEILAKVDSSKNNCL